MPNGWIVPEEATVRPQVRLRGPLNTRSSVMFAVTMEVTVVPTST